MLIVGAVSCGSGLQTAILCNTIATSRSRLSMKEQMNHPHASDLRKGRVSIPGQIYLVTCVTQDRAALFRDFAAGRKVVSALRHHEESGNAHTLAYVVMPDHLHWLFALGQEMPLPRLLASLKSYTARRIGIGGQAVWQKGYHDHALRSDEEVRDTARYVVANPLRAGLVQRLGDYPLWDAIWL